MQAIVPGLTMVPLAVRAVTVMTRDVGVTTPPPAASMASKLAVFELNSSSGCSRAIVTVTGCGLLQEPDVVPTRPIADEQGLPESALSHPRTMVYARRLCAKMASRTAIALGILPSRPILPRLEAILVEHGLPRELVAVPAVESGFQAYARGDHGELGIWQLRPATARRFGLEVNARHDERVHVDGSTRAAARYLAFPYARYGDWPLALAAYNAGEGRIDRALARRPGATFWELAERAALPAIRASTCRGSWPSCA
jgi:hypothetical protein